MADVTVEGARNLPSKLGATPDTYVLIRQGKKKFKTTVRKKSSNPYWGETIFIKDAIVGSELVIELYQRSWQDVLIGKTSVKIEARKSGESFDKWYLLNSAKKDRKSEIELRLAIKMDFSEQVKTKSTKSINVVEVDFPNETDEVLFAGQKLKTQELRKMSNVTRMKELSVLDEPFMTDFFQLVEEIKGLLFIIKLNNDAIKNIYAKYFNSMNDQRAELAEQMTSLIEYSSTETRKIVAKIKEMDAKNKQAEQSSSEVEMAIRNNIYGVLTKIFVDSMITFQDIQTQYKNMHKKTARRIYALTNPNAAPEELETIESMDLTQVLQKAASDVIKNNGREALGYIKSRHKEIMKIERSIIEIQKMFEDMSVLVASQSEIINQIQDNVLKSKAQTHAGVLELKKSKYYQSHKFSISPLSIAKLIK